MEGTLSKGEKEYKEFQVSQNLTYFQIIDLFASTCPVEFISMGSALDYDCSPGKHGGFFQVGKLLMPEFGICYHLELNESFKYVSETGKGGMSEETILK